MQPNFTFSDSWVATKLNILEYLFCLECYFWIYRQKKDVEQILHMVN